MANPQQEAGHIRISNEIWEALIKTRIPGEARQLLDFIIRKTWGYGKKEDFIPLSQFCLATGMNKANVSRNLAKLKGMNLIICYPKSNGSIIMFKFNKDFDTWKPLSKQQPRGKALSEKQQTVIRTDNKPLSETQYSITNKTTTQKQEAPAQETVIRKATPPEMTPKEKAVKFFSDLQTQELVISRLTERGLSPELAKLEIEKFIKYWTEANPSGTKLRWEAEKFFEINKRLNTWFSRIREFTGEPQKGQVWKAS